MIREDIMLAACEAHIQRTAVETAAEFDHLFRRMGVHPGGVRAALSVLWDERSKDGYVFEAQPKSLYLGAAIDGFIVGVRAARIEIHTTAPTN